LALEFASNGEFFDFIAETPRFSEKVTRYYFQKLIGALEYMHSKGYAHRDVKPENMLLDTNFTLKLADFGFSTKNEISEERRGTFGYMAPEVLAKFAHDPKKSDIFSAGVILFIMTTKHCPFVRADANDKYYKHILSGDFDTFWKMHGNSNGETKEFPESFKTLISAMLAARPGDRVTLEEIKASEWYNGPVSTDAEIKSEFKIRRRIMEGLEENSEKTLEQDGNLSEKTDQKSSYSSQGEDMEDDTQITVSKSLSEGAVTDYYMVTNGDILIDALSWFLTTHKLPFEKSPEFYRVTFKVGDSRGETTIEASVLKRKRDSARAIEFTLTSGHKDVLQSTFTQLREFLKQSIPEL
jgi:serine/threonine protein kinase